MSATDNWRLEDKDGNVIALFPPAAEWEPTATNDITENALPGEGTDALILDLSQWLFEITVQGDFEDSQNLPVEHRQALFDMGFDLPVSATDQIQFILENVVYGSSPPYNLYLGEWEFTAESRAEVDAEQGIFPNVSISEIRTPEQAGVTVSEYLFRFTVGFVES